MVRVGVLGLVGLVAGVGVGAVGTPEDVAENYESITVEQLCGYGVDLLFMQDTTGSFMDDMPYTRAQLPKLIELINVMFPNSRTGLVEFRDKPFYPLGEADDFCYKHHEYGTLVHNPAITQWAYGILQPSGGGDLPEDHYQALANAILDPTINWRPVVGASDALSQKIRAEVMANATALRKLHQDENVIQRAAGGIADGVGAAIDAVEGAVGLAAGEPTAGAPLEPALQPGDEVAARIAVIVTDATPHYNGQMALYPPSAEHPDYNVPQGLPENLGTIVADDINYSCLNQDYLDPDVIAAVVKTNNVKVITLHTADVEKVWAWINDDLFGQPAAYRQQIDALSSDLLPQLIAAITSLAGQECAVLPTVTPTVPPTVAPTVAPTPAPTTEGEVTVTPVAPTQATDDVTGVHTPCPPGNGVLIKLKERPRHMVLEVFNEDVPTVA